MCGQRTTDPAVHRPSDQQQFSAAPAPDLGPGEHLDALRALEYFRWVENGPDSRLDEGIDVLRSKQQPDRTWLLQNTHPGEVHFALEDGDGRPSRWNTLPAWRVLSWFEQTAT